MKKNFRFAFVGAIALLGAVGISSCSSSSDEVINNPDYNPEANVVKTQFAIKLPTNVTGKTRQSGTTVQATETRAGFRGMDNIVLYPFTATGAANADPIINTMTKLGEAITLKGLVQPNQATAPADNTIPSGGSGLLDASNAVLFNDVSIPIGTGSFLFYGKAIDSGTDKFVNGSLTLSKINESNPYEPANIQFTPTQVYPTGTTASTVGTALATYMSTIAQAEHWADCAVPANNTATNTWYNAALGALYTKFTEQKAGSSLDVQAVIQDLYKTIKDNTDAVSTAIKTAIENTTYVSATTGGDLTYTAAIGNSESTYFPGDVNLPDGAALLDYDSSTKTFTQKTDGNGNTGSVTASYANYIYPASLYYYSNSGVKTSTSSQISNYDGTKDWSAILNGYSDTSVGPGTRSVAILDAIQYAVGRLDMTIKTANNTLYDKIGDAYDASAGFQVTGVLIGSQKAVKYNFEPYASSTAWTLYDNIQKSQSGSILTATTTASDVNYTLALETAASTEIKVAVELINKGKSFQGADGLVPAGCKFYLVATLSPTNGTTDNGTVSGADNTGNKVFKQDYKTIANFTIVKGTLGAANTKGLGAAYNTIPDLRSPELELGLSVDLTWQEGMTFELNL